MDLERSGLAEENRKDLCCGDGSSSVSCSICLEFVVYRGERSIAKLQCGHEFHLDCIGSAFNAKGAMQCPNCRKIEKGQWLYANGYRSFADFNVEDWVNEDLYDLGYSDLPFGFQWCPFRGFMQLSSFFEEGEPLPNLYHDMLGNAAFEGSPNASTSSTHVCPYLALHGFPHPIHPTPTNAATDGLPDAAASFHRHPIALGGPSADVVNSHGFSSAEARPHGWQHVPHTFTASASASVGGLSNTEQPLSQMPSRLSRHESGGQQRLGSFVHPLHFIHGSAGRAGSSLVGSLVPPVVGDGRGHTRGPGGHHVFQQSASSSLRSPPFAPVRRPRSRGLALISATGGNASGEASEFYGFSVTGSVSLTHQDGGTGRRSDRVYGWVRDGFAPVPWVPVEGESQWWNPFHSNQNPHQAGSAETTNRSYFPQRVLPERVAQGRPDTAYQRVPLPRMSPFM